MSLKSLSSDIANFLFVVFAFYADLIALMPVSFRLILWVTIIAFQLFSYGFRVKYEKNVLVITLLLLSFVLIRNNELLHDSIVSTARLLFSIVFLLLMIHKTPSYQKMFRYMTAIGLTHVAGTYLFFFFPSLYTFLPRLWGYYPTGTSSGLYGYRAGFTNHYSHNGVVLVVTVLCFFAMLMMGTPVKKWKKRLYIALFLISFFALVMTAKRGVLIFGVISMVIVFYLGGPKNKRSRFTFLVLGGIVLLILAYFAYHYFPFVRHTISRFLTIGDDRESQSRFEFWELALANFSEHPIFGIGWLGFRFIYHDELFRNSGRPERYSYLNAHNVYVQLLCETGVVGTVLFVAVAAVILFNVFKLVRYYGVNSSYPYLRELYFSWAMQMMFLMYCFTGNCLYDATFPFYAIAAGMTLGCRLKYKDDMRLKKGGQSAGKQKLLQHKITADE